MYLDLIERLIIIFISGKSSKSERMLNKRCNKQFFRKASFYKYVWEQTLMKCLDNPDINPIDTIENNIEIYTYRYNIATHILVKNMYYAWINALLMLKEHTLLLEE